MRQENRYSNGIRLLELAIVVVLIGVLATLGINRIMALQREARLILVDGFEQSLRLSAQLVYLQSSAVGELHNTHYRLQPFADRPEIWIEVMYGYPRADNTKNITQLFDELSSRWLIDSEGTQIRARVNGIDDCAVLYRPPERPGGSMTLEKQLAGC
ncbi:pilus assembly FimT family protein [Nitrincola sp.]|uniref:pilus assembly FimT family protein n=1 Tax=Nitrincola sp. TaxID=1926584 RepID=UPI003A926D3F